MVDELRRNIVKGICSISVDICCITFENWLQHLDFCKRARSGRTNEHSQEFQRYLKPVLQNSCSAVEEKLYTQAGHISQCDV